ncbi:MAG: chemotaxis protein CheB [Lysobacteraceae bacterium]|nr:MAG: chemotaxis protein CheB [Xanthomonadaceae bacterium]
MSDPGRRVPIALLYETREGGEHLRVALADLGASVVYEASAAELDRERLAGSNASVVVVNLDDEDDPALDAVYALLDDARYRVVFNDGQVSGALSGWDQARWVRHLAAKIFGADIDPPRPADAEPVPARATSAVQETGARPLQAVEPVMHAPVQPEQAASSSSEATHASDEPAPDAAAATDFTPTAPPDPDPAATAPLVQPAGMALDLDWDFAPAQDGEGASHDEMPVAIELESESEPDLVGDLDALLVDLDIAAEVPTAPQRADDVDVELPSFELPADEGFPAHGAIGEEPDFGAEFAADLEPVQQLDATAAGERAAPKVSAPLDWSLEDVVEGGVEVAPVPAKPADFGIETMSPAEYLAPADAQDPRAEEFNASGLSLELIPLEEAVAPTAIERPETETWLDPDSAPVAKVRTVWVLGASIGGPEALREFLAEFPRNHPALFLIAQHLGAEFVDMMARQLSKSTVLTVRTPTHGERVGHGEVVIVPLTHRLQVGTDGVVVLERLAEEPPYSPSIDRVIEDVAERYGDGAGAIIFSGVSDDAVRGCSALAAKGGRVYTQSAESAVVSTMIDAVTETGVVSFSGSPKELAAKLIAGGT